MKLSWWKIPMAWCIGKAMDPRVDILVGMNESLRISSDFEFSLSVADRGPNCSVCTVGKGRLDRAHAMKGDQERCLAAGMDSYLTKPIRPQELDELL
jgi:hypothetical protein